MRTLTITVLLLALGGCKSGGADVEKTLRKLGEGLTFTQENVQSLTKSEIEKLFTHEYKVEELPLGLQTEKIEGRLTELGKKRWECFHIEHTKNTIRIYCRRRPRTYLRYVPKFF